MRSLLALCALLACVPIALAADGCAAIVYPAPPSEMVYETTAANCHVKETIYAPAPTTNSDFLFVQSKYPIPGDTETENQLDVDYTITGLSLGEHAYHVHDLGDVFGHDGLTTSYHFIGNPTNRLEIGLLNDGTPITVIDSGDSSGVFSDSQAALNGNNDIVGRSMIIHEGITASTQTRVAQCVIGATGWDTGKEVADRPTIERATCNFEPTTAGPVNLVGLVDFSVDVVDQNLWAKVFITGLNGGTYAITVNEKGSIVNEDGSSTGGVFVGETAARAKAGNLGGDGMTWTADSDLDLLMDYFKDSVVKLNGKNSIIGRSLALRSTSQTGTIIGQCVIGLKKETVGASAILPPAPADGTAPQVLAATAYFEETTYLSNDVEGFAEFLLLPAGYQGGPGVRVRYFVTGLVPGPHAWHVHLWGDLSVAAGTSAGGHFAGYYSGRPNSLGVGEIGNMMNITADAYGVAKGEFIDCCLFLNGYNSIIGRSIVIHEGNSIVPGNRVAWGVIGRTLQTTLQKDYETQPVTTATCNIQPTTAGLAINTLPAGTISFTWNTVDNVMEVSYSLTGFASSVSLPWHIHDWGNLFDSGKGQSVGGHLIGNATRSTCPNEAGRLNDGGNLAFDGAGTASGSFDDTEITFTGINNILGRSIIIHGGSGGDTSTRSAMCVIGLTGMTTSDPGNPCDDVDCNSPTNGNCTTEWVVTVGQNVCLCAEGFEGDNCEIDTTCASPGDCPGPSDDASAASSLVPSLFAAAVVAFFARRFH